jgi:photosystem II stability/assembly factor-like uncharacterized protein
MNRPLSCVTVSTVRTVILSLASVLAVFLGLALSSASAGASDSGWQVSANYPQAVYPASVTCASASLCFVIGNQPGPNFEVTNDGGTTWLPVSLPTQISAILQLSCPSSTVCFGMAFDVSFDLIMVQTTDAGATWVPVTGFGTGLAAGRVSCASATTCVVVGSDESGNGIMMRTTDAGSTWSTPTLPVAPSFSSLDLVACGGSSCVADGLDSSGSFDVTISSADGGSTWSVDSNGGLSDASCSPSGNCVAATNTSDGTTTTYAMATLSGTTWTQHAIPATVNPLHVVCSSATICFAGGNTVGSSLLGGEANVIASTDGGMTWATQTLPASLPAVDGLSCPSPSTCVAVGNDFLATGFAIGTTDGGTTWGSLGLPGTLGFFSQVTCPSTTVCLVLSDTQMLRSTDRGTTWHPVSLPTGAASLSGLTCPSATSCVATGEGVATFSSDGGATWAQGTLPASPPSGGWQFGPLACDSVTHCISIMDDVSGFDLLATSDGGATWAATTVSSLSTLFGVSSLSCPAAGTCLGVFYGSPNSLGVSTDAGAEWTLTPLPFASATAISCASATNCEIAGGAQDTGSQPQVEGTTNGGSTWSLQALPDISDGFQVGTLACNPSASAASTQCILSTQSPDLSTAGTLYATTDGGTTWSSQTLPSPSASDSFTAAACPSDLICVIAGSGGSKGGGLILSEGESSVPALTISTDPTAQTAGLSVTYSATVASALGTPTGTVAFTTGTTTLCTATLSSGSGSCSAANAPAGSDTITGTYSGDLTFQTATASASLHVGEPTSTTASASPTTTTYHSAVTFAASVSGSGGTPSGTVSFSTAGVVLCSATLDGNGQGTCNADGAPTGSDTIDVSYAGDSAFLPSTATTTLGVQPAPTTTTVVSPPPPASAVTHSSPVSYQATVVSTAGAPTGSVTFVADTGHGSTSLCTAPVTSGKAACTSSAAPIGLDDINASYLADGNFAPSRDTVRLEVDATSTTTLNASPSSVNLGSSVTYDASVTTEEGAGSGSVSVDAGAIHLCTITLGVDGTGLCAATNAPAGTDTITASFQGTTSSGDFAATSSGTTTLLVSVPAPSPVPGTTSSMSGESVTPNGTASATTGKVTATGTGIGSVTVGSYSGNPTSGSIRVPDGGSVSYDDVAVGSGSAFSSLDIKLCGVTTPYSLEFWSGTSWEAFSPLSAQSYDPTTGCVTITLSAASGIPTIGELTGTPVAVVNEPAVHGKGYWLVASDGGVFSYGDAAFYGSAGAIHLSKPIVGMSPTPDGKGYWLVASDGGVFSYGDAAFYGSAGAIHLSKPIVGMTGH